MNPPLYKEARTTGIPFINRNKGLWYDKFCGKWRSEGKDNPWSLRAYEVGQGNQRERHNPKLEWIQDAVDRESDEIPIRSLVERTRMLVTANGGCAREFRTSGPFVSGMGRSHPVENGFCWHHLLGEPYLPGSSVKGMVLAWARDWFDDSKLDDAGKNRHKETWQRVFGDAKHRGSVIFLDALPVGRIKLKADIMTPHYAEYYEKGDPPADWYNPTPIPFLAVQEDQPFLFSIMPARQDDDGVKDVQQTMKWLEAALATIGAGAKTAVGYGRFGPQP